MRQGIYLLTSFTSLICRLPLFVAVRSGHGHFETILAKGAMKCGSVCVQQERMKHSILLFQWQYRRQTPTSTWTFKPNSERRYHPLKCRVTIQIGKSDYLKSNRTQARLTGMATVHCGQLNDSQDCPGRLVFTTEHLKEQRELLILLACFHNE
jgi:hypothetical protein